jgi:hypothetical protein
MTVKMTGVRRAVLAGLTTVLGLALSGPAHAIGGEGSVITEAPPTDQIVLEVAAINGSGCPAGTASVSTLPDNTGFKVTYRDFLAQAGGNSGPTDFRKNCQISLEIHFPQGFTFAIAKADYRGRAHLQAGATALHRTNYYFQGSSDNTFAEHSFAGPLNAPWQSTDITAIAALIFAPCGVSRNLNVNTELRVDDGTSKGVSSMSMRSSDGDIDTIFHVHWKRCT